MMKDDRCADAYLHSSLTEIHESKVRSGISCEGGRLMDRRKGKLWEKEKSESGITME